MPRGDGTGPDGKGPAGNRRMVFCVAGPKQRMGQGKGKRQGQGQGQGRCQGQFQGQGQVQDR